MNCADVEILLCDYVDGTLHGEQKSAVERHLAGCEACAELVRDASSAVSFMERVPAVEPPAELMTRLMFEAGTVRERYRPSATGWLRRLFEPILQPRFAMGMAMTVFSFALLGRVTGINVRQLELKDLNPVAVYHAAEDRIAGVWNSTVKYYESLRLVYEIQTRLREAREQNEEAAPATDNGQQQRSPEQRVQPQQSPQNGGNSKDSNKENKR